MNAPASLAEPALLDRARAARSRGEFAEAEAELRRGLEACPDWVEAHHQLGNLLKNRGRAAEAVASLSRAVLLDPSQAAIWLNLGAGCLDLERPADAVDCFRHALALQPYRPEAWNVLGHALLSQGLIGEAERSLKRALELKPDYAAAHDNLGRLCKAQGRAEEALRCHRAALKHQPRATTHSNLLYTLNFVHGLDPAEIAAEHRRWAELYAPAAAAPATWEAGTFAAGKRLRVGYLSPDLVHHSVSYFFEPVLAGHDSAVVESFCYSDAPAPDAVTDRLRRLASAWRDTSRLSDDALAAGIRSDRIDILVDLAGHTARNRLTVFARRPAPVQVTWLGYPNTTGLSAIDYRLTDATSDPSGQTEAWHSEKLCRIPEGFLCYRAPAEAPPVQSLPALENGFITFGCFNNFAKVNPPTIELWAKILGRVPGSHLFLKSRGLGDPGTLARLRNQFRALGVESSRLKFNAEELSVERHLALYHKVDIALDTFPYNGTTTTCEALWMGVPVVTLAGSTHVSRVGASLLRHVPTGPVPIRTEPVPVAPPLFADGYVAAAVGLARDLVRLAELRAGFRERMRGSSLCDQAGFARRLEGAFRGMWAERCARG